MREIIKNNNFQTRSRLTNEDHSTAMQKTIPVEKRLLAIPILYIFLRMWGTLQSFYSLIVSNSNHGGCIPSTVKIVYTVFGILQVSLCCSRVLSINYVYPSVYNYVITEAYKFHIENDCKYNHCLLYESYNTALNFGSLLCIIMHNYMHQPQYSCLVSMHCLNSYTCTRL